MENVTSIFNFFNEELFKFANQKDKIDKICSLFNEHYGVKLSFCKIYGKRWSHFAGPGYIINESKRLKLDGNFGVIIENDYFSNQFWNEFKIMVNRILNDT